MTDISQMRCNAKPMGWEKKDTPVKDAVKAGAIVGGLSVAGGFASQKLILNNKELYTDIFKSSIKDADAFLGKNSTALATMDDVAKMGKGSKLVEKITKWAAKNAKKNATEGLEVIAKGVVDKGAILKHAGKVGAIVAGAVLLGKALFGNKEG